MADENEVAKLFVIEFDYRSDDGERLVGPFTSEEGANEHLETLRGPDFRAEYSIVSLAAVAEAAEAAPDEEMPVDEPEEGEELITEIPVHGVATLEGRATGDGRGFRPGAISFGRLPAPLGYEFESGHGSDNSRVAVIGRIDEFWTVPLEGEEGVFEVRWRGVIMTDYERSAEAIQHIIDGSYQGLSVVVDSVTVDVSEEREEMRARILADQDRMEPMAEGDDDGPRRMSAEEIEEVLDAFIGDGTQPTTWFSAARVRRFDMVPTGAFQEGDIWLGSEFADELSPEALTASAAALEDCGCFDGIVDWPAVDLSSLSVEELDAFDALTPAEQLEYARERGLVFREISAEERKKLAEEGKALPDGSFPIANVDDLRNAIQAIGRASDPEAAKRHIKKRAKDLGQEDLIPDDWAAKAADYTAWPGDLTEAEQAAYLRLIGVESVQMLGFSPSVARRVIELGSEEAWRAEDARDFAAGTGRYAPGTKDGPGWITHPIPTARIRRYWVRGKGAAKIRWGVPGDFNRCRLQLAKYVQNPEWLAGLCANMHKEAIGVWPGQEVPGGRGHSLVAAATPRPLFSLVAAAAPVDAALFANPNLTEPTNITIDGERVYGHIAVWNVCHISQPEGANRCTLAPRSMTNYAHFRTGTVRTTEGPIAVGQLTMNTGHADGYASASAAAAHYDNTGTVVADVVVGEDAIGIWYSGRIRPTVSDDDLFAFEASGRLSGDWRPIGGNYELVGALCVNVGGFNYANTALVASAEGLTAILSAGMVEPDLAAPTTESLTAERIAEITVAAVETYILSTQRAQIVEEVAPARAALNAHTLAHARTKLAELVKE